MENPIKNGWFGWKTHHFWFNTQFPTSKMPQICFNLPVCMMRCCMAPEAFCRITSCCTTCGTTLGGQTKPVGLDDMQCWVFLRLLHRDPYFQGYNPYIYIYIVSIILYSKQPGLTRKKSKHFNISRDLSRWKKNSVSCLWNLHSSLSHQVHRNRYNLKWLEMIVETQLIKSHCGISTSSVREGKAMQLHLLHNFGFHDPVWKTQMRENNQVDPWNRLHWSTLLKKTWRRHLGTSFCTTCFW